MSFVLQNTRPPRELPSEDEEYVAGIAEVVDLGMLPKFESEDLGRQGMLICQLNATRTFTKDGVDTTVPETVKMRFNAGTSSPKSTIAKFLKKAFGLTLSDGFDFSSLAGKAFRCEVEHATFKGNKYLKLATWRAARDTDESPLDLGVYVNYATLEQLRKGRDADEAATDEDIPF